VFDGEIFDASAGRLSLAYVGQSPVFALDNPAPTVAYLNFVNAAIATPGVHYGVVTHYPAVDFWIFAKRAGLNALRLELKLPYGGYLRVRDDKAQHKLVIEPQLGQLPPGYPLGSK
jgi:hypothetical protein